MAFPIPMIQIHQQYAQLGVQTTPRSLDIKQPEATLDLKQVPAELSIKQGSTKLNIDQSDAWDALLLGGALKTSSRVYAAGQQAVLEGIARRVQDGRRILESLPDHVNDIAARAKAHRFDSHPIQAAGAASALNVHVNFDVQPAQIRIQPNGVINNSHVNKPEVNPTLAKVNIYLERKASVEITPPQIDLTV